MSEQIWGGDDINRSKQVGHKVIGKNFAEFVEVNIDIPVNLPFSKSEFAAFTIDQQRESKKVPFFLPCSLTPNPDGPTPRTAPTGVRLICIDVDDQPVIPENLDGKIPWNYVAYTTASHTPEAPRYRIVVEAANLKVDTYPVAVAYIADRIGLPADWKGRVESSKISQPMFKPVQFRSESGHPVPAVFACRVKGAAITESEIPSKSDPVLYHDDDFGIGADPIPSIEPGDVEEMLESIDPDCERHVWVKIICSLKHQFRDKQKAQDAFTIFNNWSSTGTKYKGTNDCLIQWKSAKPDPTGKTAAATVRSVIMMAKQGGWTSDKLAARAIAGYTAWLNSASGDDLFDIGAKKLAEIEIIGVQSLTFLKLKMEFIKEVKKHGLVLPLVRLEKMIRAEHSKLDDIARSLSNETPPWLRPFVYISGEDRFISKSSGQRIEPMAFRRCFNMEMMTIGERHGSLPSENADDFALNTVKIPRAEVTGYDPRKLPGSLYKSSDEKKLLLNTYNPSLPAPNAALASLAEIDLRKHLTVLAGNPSYGETLLQFIAHVVQNPGVKIRWMPVICSIEGVGKSLLADVLSAVIGRADVCSVGPSSHGEKYNSWMSGSVLVVLEEITVVGKTPENVIDSLKAFLSNDTVSVRRMRTDTYEVDNTANAMAFSNRYEGLPITQDARRFFVLHCPLTLETRKNYEAQGYFNNLQRWKEPTWAGGMRSFLLNYKIPATFPVNGPAPETVARQEMISSGQGEDWSIVLAMMSDPNEGLVSADFVAVKQVSDKLKYTRNARPATDILRRMAFRTLIDENGNSVFFSVANLQTPVMVSQSSQFNDKSNDEIITALRRQDYISKLDDL